MMLDALPGLHAGGSTLYFPHIASDGIWETEICMINAGDGSIFGELIAYTDSGEEVAIIPVNIGPNARREMRVGDEFPNPSSIGYVNFYTFSRDTCGYLKFYIDGDSRVAIPAASEINSGDIYISHIASDESWVTGISLLNTTLASKVLSIEFNNGMTRTISLAANEHRALTIRELFNNKVPAGIQSAVIKNGNGVVGLEIFGTTEASGLNYLSGILLSSATTSSIYYPHFAGDSVWETGIVAYNPSATPCNLTIRPFKSDGTMLPSRTVPLEGKEKYVGTARQLNFHEEAAWMWIEATRPITGFELFGINPNSVDDDGDGYTESQGDCDDHDAGVYPGAPETCGDGIDQDCDGSDPLCSLCADISGTWYAQETVNITCCMDGDCESDSFTGDGSITIEQNGCNISYDMELAEYGTFERKGSIEGNNIQMSGIAAVLVPGCTAITNNINLYGTVNGSQIDLEGSLVISGSCDGETFSCTGNSVALLSRSNIFSARDEQGSEEMLNERHPFLNGCIEILGIIPR
ncbi:MAG: putative metal-binding motif-containing protein [Deltaproteobacteria bacterium]|nr:putative metal-binding motif-containing protein [Deltaproteobacteria bacterium]